LGVLLFSISFRIFIRSFFVFGWEWGSMSVYLYALEGMHLEVKEGGFLYAHFVCVAGIDQV